MCCSAACDLSRSRPSLRHGSSSSRRKKLSVLLWTALTICLSVTSVDAARADARLRCNPSILRHRRKQCFVEIPPPVVYVPMGDTVELKCTIGNLQPGHSVQWVHNVSGFLGSGSIPIQKTYAFSYIGDISRGQKYLQIRNMSLDLQGKYECQVPPNPNLLRIATEVIVLVKPSAPVIYMDGAPMSDGSKVSIRPKAVNQEFVCAAVGGNPRPEILWYRIPRDHTASMPLRKRMRLKTEDGMRVRGMPDSLSATYESRLLLSVRGVKNGDRLVCTVSNEATKRHHDRQKKFLKTTVRVELQSPPGEPKIHRSSKEVYYEGDSLAAVCTARRGVPAGSLIWHQLLADNTEGRKFASYEVGQRDLTNRLRIASLTQADHNSRLICEASNEVTQVALRAILPVQVSFAPRTVSIHSDPRAEKIITRPDGRHELVVYGRAGYSKTLTCRTDLYFPTANISWQRENQKISPQRDKVIHTPAGYILESNISVTFTRRDNDRYYDCRAYGVRGGRADARVKLSIMYPPGRPYLDGLAKGRAYNMGARITLRCISVGGSPQPDLFWYKTTSSEKIETEQQKTVGNRRLRKLTLVASKQNNGDEYYCVAVSPAMTTGRRLTSEKYRLHVRFPPENVAISMVGKAWSMDGEPAVVLCKADTSSPAAVIRWKQIRCTRQGRCTSSSLDAYKVEGYPGRFSGTETHSQVRLRTSWRDDGTYIECEAFNPKLGAPTLNDRIKLNVTFAPKFTPLGDITVGDFASRAVQEGANVTLEMGVVANPEPSEFTWLFGDRRFDGNSRVLPVRGKLVLKNVRRRDAGNYTLLVANKQGRSSLKFFLNVTYPPTLIGPAGLNLTVSGDHAQLECAARANPPITTGFKWRRVDSLAPGEKPRLVVHCNQGEWNKQYKYFAKCRRPFGPTGPQGSPMSGVGDPTSMHVASSLVIYSIGPQDVGYYQCIVQNGIGRPVTKTFEVIVPFSPIMANKPRFTKAAGELGSTVSLRCLAKGEPKVSFAWFRGPDNLTLIEAEKYRMSSRRLRPGLYEATLKIHNLQRSDHGIYFCQANNIVGTNTLRLKVSGTGFPDIPSRLRSVNATDHSVSLRWVQGFDGGSPQTFTLRWKEMGESLYSYRDVAPIPAEEEVECVIAGLRGGKKYEFSVKSRNKLHGDTPFSVAIVVTTKPALGPIDRIRGKGSLEEDMPVLIIVAACVFAFIVLIINIVVVAFIVRRRGHCGGGLRGMRRKDRSSQNVNFCLTDGADIVVYLKAGSTDAYEMRSSQGDGSYRRSSLQGDDEKTYSSYDGTNDEVRDLIKKYPNEMFVPHNAFVDLLYPGTAFRHPSLAPIGETQLMGPRGPGIYAGAAMDQPTLMARPSPLARMSPSSLSATSHERAAPTTFQPVVLLNQHATPSDPGQPGTYSPQPGPSGADLLTNGYRPGSLTTFPATALTEAQQRHSYAEELRRVQYTAAVAAAMQQQQQQQQQPNLNGQPGSKPLSGHNSNSSTLNSRHNPGSVDAGFAPGSTAPFGSRGGSPRCAMPVAPAAAAPPASSADLVIRYTPNGQNSATSSLLRPGKDCMV